MTKITFILPSYPWKPIGGYKVVYEYANHLSQRGYDVVVIHSCQMKNIKTTKNVLMKYRSKILNFFAKCLQKNVNWHSFSENIKVKNIDEPIAKNVPDADYIFCTSWETAEYVYKFPAEKGEKFYLIQGFETFSGDKEIIEKTWNYPFKKVLISRCLYEKALSMGISTNEIFHIPNGIDHNKFFINNDIYNRKNQIAMLYHLSPNKGSIIGLKALEIVKNKFPNLKVILFGTSSRPKLLPSWINYIKNPTQEKLLNEIYNDSSIFVCSSFFEGWGLTGAEAISCGCALVSTDNGGVRDYLVDGKTGLLSEPGDVEELAKNILILLNNNDLRYSLAKAGYDYIQNFNWDRSVDLLEKFMNEN